MTGSGSVRRALDELTRRAREAGEDPVKMATLVSEAAQLNQEVEELRDLTRTLIVQAILARVDPQTLYGKPFSAHTVRTIYNELRAEGHDLPELRTGPRPRRGRTAS